MVNGKAAILERPKELNISEINIPDEIGPHRALLKVEACGICGTDLAQYNGELDLDYPVIPGHEIVGRIDKIGDAAKNRWGIETGTRVAVSSPEGCGVCPYCNMGKVNLCEQRFSYGFSSFNEGAGLWGGFSEFVILRPNTVVHEIPEGLPSDLAVLFNPLGNGLEWVNKASPQFGDSVLILGPGQRGLSTTIACRERGVGDIIITGKDSDKTKFKLAERFGADYLLNVDKVDTVERVLDLTEGKGVDCVIDTTPNATQPVIDAVELVKPGGTIVLTGHKDMQSAPIVIDEVIMKELTIEGAFIEGPWADREALRILNNGEYPIESMHSDTIQLSELESSLLKLSPESDEEVVHLSVKP